MNPPFDDATRMRASPHAVKRAAHSAETNLLADWTHTAARILKPGGNLGLIHRPEELSRILRVLDGTFGDIRIRPVYPALGRPAIRVLVEARAGRRGPTEILPGLVLHEADGAWTAEADAILRGEAALSR
jgi:tRNA1(Val) A37 N6-methylase TrmN6